MGILTVIVVLVSVILFLIVLAVAQIKMAGMYVTDFWFSKKYERLSPQQQVLFLSEAEKIFSAFDKVPDALWEEEYQKYMEILNKYKEIRILRWESTK